MDEIVCSPQRGVILVTGASSGVGAAVARGLRGLVSSSEGPFANHELVLLGRSDEKLATLRDELGRAGCDVITHAGDISDPNHIESVLSPIMAGERRLSVVIHCAGVGHFGEIEETGLDEIAEMIATNVSGTALLLRSVVPFFKEQRGGHLVVITSDVARRPLEGGSVYSASKFAQRSLVASIRKEVLSYGVKVSEVMPGLIDTNFHASPAGSAAHQDWLRPEDVAWWIQMIVSAPSHVVVDELMIHPLSQRY